MSGKNKHIYSKEELLKLIKDGKNSSTDMDEFDLEALDGLKLVDNHDVLNELDTEIDSIVNREKNKKKAIYYVSTAASVLLIIGMFFFFKTSSVIKNEKVVASNELKPTEKFAKPQESVASVEKEPQPQISERISKQQSAPKAVATSKDEMDFGLAENKAKQKSDNSLEQETTSKADQQEIALGDADTKSGGTIDREAFQHQASKDMNTVISTQAGVTHHEENKTENTVRSKKVVAAMSQPSMAYQSNDQASFTEQSPPAPPADDKKSEEKAKSDLFYANKALKNDAAKNYKEPSFIAGDSTFAAYVKQNLKISSPANSGIMVAAFLVNKNGTATNIEILKSLNNCDACSKDVIDFIKSIKKWQPALQNGSAITAPKKISIQYN